MPVPNLRALQEGASLDQVNDYLFMMRRWLNDFLAHMDTLNIDELNANVIIAKTITADKMDVAELSAISANLGHITAGLIEAVQIYGSYIATSTGYPRVEMSSTGNLFGALYDPNNSLTIIPSYAGSPSLAFTSGGTFLGFLRGIGSTILLQTVTGVGDIQIGSGGDLILYASTISGKYVIFESWDRMKNAATGNTLQQDLNSINASISSLSSNISSLFSLYSSLDSRVTALENA